MEPGASGKMEVMTRRRLAVLAAAAAVVAGVIVGGAFGYESSRSETIADGVTIGGVDVGGLDAAAAETRVRTAIGSRLSAPLVVRSVHSRFAVHRSDFGVRIDVATAVREALARSRNGSFLSRAWRDLTGGGLDATVPLRVRYSPEKVDRTLEGLRRSIDRRPQNARLQISVTSLRVSPGAWGRRFEARAFRNALVSWLVSAASPRLLRVPFRIVRPPVTEQSLIARNRFFITIDRNQKRLRLFRRLRLFKTYTIAVGRIGLETPAGLYHVRTKAVNPAWYVPRSAWAGSLAGTIIPGGSPDNPIKARWLGFYDGAGIHGTDDLASLGTAASHGCIRMSVPDVIQLYGLVPVGTRILIV